MVIRAIRSHIHQYIADIHTRSFGGSAIKFWHQKEQTFTHSVLRLIVQDLVSVVVASIYGKIVFGLRNAVSREWNGMERNRMDKSLNRRAWLKVNDDSLVDMGV